MDLCLKLICYGPQVEFSCNVSFVFVDCPTQVPIKCDITWVVLPMVNLRQVRKTASAGSEPNQKGRGKGVAKGGRGHRRRAKKKKKAAALKAVVYRKFPVMLPSRMALALLKADAGHLLWLCCVD